MALSSRNAYLSPEERVTARTLPRILGETAQAVREGAEVAIALEAARATLLSAGFASVDYVALCDAETLDPIYSLAHPARLLAAARLGTTRLIDNIPVDAK